MDRIATHVPPLVGRIWRGRVPANRLSEYLAYNRVAGLGGIASASGCLGVQQFSAVVGKVATVTTISYWMSVDAMAAHHTPDGGDITLVSHLDRDPEFLLEIPERVELVDVHVNAWQPKR
jgi:hypothetical protein